MPRFSGPERNRTVRPGSESAVEETHVRASVTIAPSLAAAHRFRSTPGRLGSIPTWWGRLVLWDGVPPSATGPTPLLSPDQRSAMVKVPVVQAPFDVTPGGRGKSMAQTAPEPQSPLRQCGRCRLMFEGDATGGGERLPQWWLCAPCRSALLPNRARQERARGDRARISANRDH